MEKLNIDLILHKLNEYWGDGKFYEFEYFRGTSIKFRASKNYRSIIKQLEKESLIERKGGRMAGRRMTLINNGETAHFGKRRYINLSLRITLKGHEYLQSRSINEKDGIDVKMMIVKIIDSIQRKNPSFVKRYKDDRNHLDEDDFRSEFYRIMNVTYNVTSEEDSRVGRTDLIIYFDDSKRSIFEFKIWGRNDYKETVKQIYGYLTDSDKEGFIVMVNPNKNLEIDNKYKDMIIDEEMGFINDSFKEHIIKGFKFYKSEHKIGIKKKIIYHFILNLY